MIRRVLSALAFVCLAAPALAQSDGDPQIDATRLGVMIDQAGAALHAIEPKFPDPQAASGAVEGDAYTQLTSAVRRYDALIAQACRAALVGAQFCGAPYDPPWLNRQPPDLRAAIDEASNRVSALWRDVCGRAKKTDPAICVME